jgi:hypothetical protein
VKIEAAKVRFAVCKACGVQKSSLGKCTIPVFYNKKALIAHAMRAGYWVGIDLLSRGIYRSTIGAGRLNYSVRNGKR